MHGWMDDEMAQNLWNEPLGLDAAYNAAMRDQMDLGHLCLTMLQPDRLLAKAKVDGLV